MTTPPAMTLQEGGICKMPLAYTYSHERGGNIYASWRPGEWAWVDLAELVAVESVQRSTSGTPGPSQSILHLRGGGSVYVYVTADAAGAAWLAHRSKAREAGKAST